MKIRIARPPLARTLALLLLAAVGTAAQDLAPPALRAAVEATLRAERREVRAETSPGHAPSWILKNEGLGLGATFDGRSMEVVAETAGRPGRVGLRLTAWGRRGAVERAPRARVHADGPRVEYRRGPLVEWYVNRAGGIEQGFTLAEPPGAAVGSGPLELRLAVTGGLTVEVVDAGRGAHFSCAEPGGVTFTYSGLVAWDARGRELWARLVARPGGLAILVDDRDAAYPLVIDPLIATQQAKLVSNDGNSGDRFGFSVAISGDTALVGAVSEGFLGGSLAGSAYVFVRQGTAWSQQAKLVANDAQSGDQLGASVALEGDTAVVGTSREDDVATDSGAAYVFRRTGTSWTQVARLKASDAAQNDQFATSLGLSGDTILVGAPLVDGPAGFTLGAAYVFVETAGVWSEQAKLTASDAAPSSWFGESVAISGETAVIGAYFDDTIPESGSAYVFERTGTVWTEVVEIFAGDADGGFERFGRSVSIDGDTLAVGAPWENDGAAESGAAFVFVRDGSTWTEQAKLKAPAPDVLDLFGYSVSISGERLLVGCPGDDDAGPGFGAAYLFERQGSFWIQQAKVFPGTPDGSSFGTAVSLDGDLALIGDDTDDLGASNVGSAYVFVLADTPGLGPASCFGVGCPCGNDDPGAGCATSTGGGALLTATGTASVGADDLRLLAAGIPPNNNGLCYMGDTVVANPFFDGFQCALGNTFRFLDSIQGSGGTGTMEYTGVVASSGLVTPGSTWHFHFWFRDVPGSPCDTGANLTNLYSVTFGP